MLDSKKDENRNLEEQLVLSSSGITLLFLFPSSLYRFFSNDFVLGSIYLLVSLMMMVAFYQAWHSKQIKYLKILTVISFMIAILGLIYLNDLEVVFWAYPAIGATYLLLPTHLAVTANIIFIFNVLFLLFDKFNNKEALSFYLSLILICLFGYFYSLRTAHQNKKLINLACEDALTKLKNRRSFDEKVAEIMAHYQRRPYPISMMLLDLDEFKTINDSYGHKQGDKVLVDFARIVQSRIRSTDDIYRFGGEEFVVIANNSSLDDSGKLAESIRQHIANTSSLSKYNVTVSIGVSEILKKDDADSWFRRADRALYESKASGRNKVRLARIDENNEIYCKALDNR